MANADKVLLAFLCDIPNVYHSVEVKVPALSELWNS